MQELKTAVSDAVKAIFSLEMEIELSRPEEKFGDYSTNVAMQLSAKLGKNPKEVAEQLRAELQKVPSLDKVEIAGPGFINFKLSDEVLQQYIHLALKAEYGTNDLYRDQVIVLEHTDPNPFKEFHIGHAYSNTIGASIGLLLENAGARVHQVSYHGDVGLHIAMAVWAFGKHYDWNVDAHKKYLESQGMVGGSLDHIRILGMFYKEGAQAYKNEQDGHIKTEIENLNEYIYQNLGNYDDQKMYFYYYGRQESFRYFNFIYTKILKNPIFNNSENVFEKGYLESEVANRGEGIVREHIGDVFLESDGAIIYDGEKKGLHKRVFITRKNLPTYEAKEIGLAFVKRDDYPKADKFIVITANEIADYFKVLLAAISDIDEGLARSIQHTTHGVVKLPYGKMSSRTGDVKSIVSADVDISDALKKLHGKEAAKPEVVFAAMKYAFLKHRLGEDIVYDPHESMSVEGNSGPYLQYAYARARSIMNKAGNLNDIRAYNYRLNESERSLVRKISELPEVIEKATLELKPHYICTYLFDLTQSFNRFYEKNRVLGSDRELDRITLLSAYIGTLGKGLKLLNIEAPDKI